MTHSRSGQTLANIEKRNTVKTFDTQKQSLFALRNGHTTAPLTNTKPNLIFVGGPANQEQQQLSTLMRKSTAKFVGSPAISTQLSVRNNFENKQSRKAILKSTLAEIEREISYL